MAGILYTATLAPAADLDALAEEYARLTDPFVVAARDLREELGSTHIRRSDGRVTPRAPGEHPYVRRERRKLELEEILEAAGRLPEPPDPALGAKVERMLYVDPASKGWLDREGTRK